MNKENKTSILNDALKDIKDIVDEAKKNVYGDIEKMIPEKFDKLLKEEVDKIKKNKESGKGKIQESINEDIGMGDEMGVDAPVEEPMDGELEDVNFDEINFDDIKAQLEDGGDVENDLEQAEALRQESENMTEMENVNDPFERMKKIQEMVNDIMNEMEHKKMDEEYGSQFESQMMEMYGENYKDALGEEKCGELYEAFIAHKKGDPFGEKKESVNETEEQMDEMKQVGGLSGPDQNKGNENEAGGPKPERIEEEEEVEEKDVERSEEEEMDESKAHGYSHSAQKTAGSETTDGKDYAEQNNLFRYAITKSQKQNESLVKKLNSVLAENKKLTKNLNETKAMNSKLHEGMKKAKGMLADMAVFNTSLSHVNNILVNEEVEDKKEVIKRFDTAKTIEESDTIYKNIIKEMKEEKATITEDVERKVTGSSTGTSSKNILESKEVKQKTAYTNLDKITKNMFYQSGK